MDSVPSGSSLSDSRFFLFGGLDSSRVKTGTAGHTFTEQITTVTNTMKRNVLVSFPTSRLCLVENRLFRFGPESALLDQIEMISFDGADSGTNSDVLVSFLLDVGTFVERVFLYCFDITNTYP
jgi:hypothetical protein